MSISGDVEREYGKKETGITNLNIITAFNSRSKKLNPVITSAQTAPDGRFYIGELNHYDTLNFFIQARMPKGGKKVLVRRDFFGVPETTHFPPADTSTFASLNEAYLRSIASWARSDRAFRLANGGILLNEVVVKADKPKEDHRRLHSKDAADAVIMISPEDDMLRENVLEYLRGTVAGVMVTGSGMSTNVSIRGGGTPAFVLDGFPVDLETVLMLPTTDLESLEVLKGLNGAMYSNNENGVIVIFSKRGNSNYDYSKEPARGVITFQLPGYNRPGEFYVPRYDVPDDRHNLPDFRNTLHWQPRLTTNTDGKAQLSFFTSDDATSFTTVCEGFTGKGAVGTGVHTFKVEQKK